MPLFVRRRSGFPPKLSQLVQTRRLRFFGHAVRMDPSLDINRTLRVSVRGLPRDWKRPAGRPRHTWLRSVEADLLPLNLGLNAAWRLAQNRTRWRHFIETATLQSAACSWWLWWWWWCYWLCYAHCAVAMDERAYLPCAPMFKVAVILLLRVHGQMDKNIGRFTIQSYW